MENRLLIEAERVRWVKVALDTGVEQPIWRFRPTPPTDK
jgi:hypothetical protein